MKIASIVLCAGVGSRLNSKKSKILHEIGGRVVGYWPVKNAAAASALKPIVVLGYQAAMVEEELNKHFLNQIQFAYQSSPDGTAAAVKAALPYLDPSAESVLVVCGDTPLLKKESLEKLVTIQRKSHVPIAMMTAIAPDPSGYGRIIRNANEQIVAIVEDKEASPLEREISEINPGVYVFDAEFLRENIHKVKPSAQKKEFYLTDLVAMYIKEGPNNGPIGNVTIDYEEVHGVNDRRQLAYAQAVLNRRLIDEWMLKGVTFIAPDQSYVEESVVLASDVVIYPGVHLRGQTRVAEGVIIENGCVIKDSVIESDAHILPYTCIEQAHVGSGATVGPFARLRPEAHLEEQVKVGNFVEVKRSRLKKGAKANHLSYIGDAEVGEGANIGAGTITCNFDGHEKHKTVIGDGAFIGSNATLIAPLVIGDKAFIAGGSTINQAVPAGALAFGRAHQVNKEQKGPKKTKKMEARC